MTIDSALNVFNSYKEEFEALKKQSISETDTRCKILDRILIGVLGWEEKNITREDYVQSMGFYDYMVSTGLASFVVEAKKTLAGLVLPKSKKAKLKTLLSDPSNKEVIHQIRGYLIEKGLTHGVISNGHQFIIARFLNTNGEDWKNNSAIIFNGFDDIEKRFIEFYEVFSRESILQKGRIEIREETKFDKKLIGLSRLLRKNEKLVRNELSDKLIKIIDIIFREIDNTSSLDKIETLKKCYVFNDDVRKHQSEMSLMFQDSPPKFDEKVFGVRNTIHTQEAIEEKLLDGSFSLPNPIVLIGGKGAGKTTFIKYFFKVSIKDTTRKKIPNVYIDFRAIYSHLDNPEIIYQKILDELYREHSYLNLKNYAILKRIYRDEIKHETNNGLWSIFKNKPEELELKINSFIEQKLANSQDHLAAVSKYLINPCHKRLCVIFDNVDQLDFDVQKNAFLFAQSIHLSLKCIIIISLREGYYYQWKDKPPFDAYQPNIFHLTAPPYRDVLKKRIQYVVDDHTYSDTEGSIENKIFKLSDVTQQTFFKNLYTTLFRRKNSEILEFLEQTSYPNIRLGLEKFNNFLISGHTKVEEYMTKDDFNIPIWEFVKSVALESNYYYFHNKSKIFNIFYPSQPGGNHFTKLRILHYLINEAELTSYKEHYIPSLKLLDSFVKCGYNRDNVLSELQELLKFGLINCESYVSDTHEVPLDITGFQISVTQSGIYYSTRLVTEFFYMDLVLQDTPIYEPSYFDDLSHLFCSPNPHGSRPIDRRIQCVEIFVKYLINQETRDRLEMAQTDNKALRMNIMGFILDSNLRARMKTLSFNHLKGIVVNLD
ncbi:P-loop NTPase fold protein [Flagellimonas eckloniae]|uniref:Orc1-like AAA ATPase domain-containing protein n=1 Tax=Flagellimonas eckloniae TaxID=346185 RepID=A0A0Q1BZG9_9FLAO|nr:P-loop NTPase fold protein [Allomuricauda eckloniae]KQC30222.1 hypothetical protein AAY42_10300 [Allomuricauda eckloniae]